MSPDVLRRKLAKKLNRRQYGRCEKCGDRFQKRMASEDNGIDYDHDTHLEGKCACGHVMKYYWTGKPG